jgi:GalNAc-alpha-(1->4)-GalNAc-alpha-(1->3)-diNAcBac-PP-undecaprenol alpha-1,4-N-acetyl-D-galactosaminyltransferase
MSRKILLLVSSMNSGGAERVAANLVNAWSARGDSVTLLITFSGRGECFYPVSDNVKVIYLADLAGCTGRNLSAYWARLRTLRKFIRTSHPDAVVSFLSNVNIAAILACRRTGCRVIVSERIHPPMLLVSWLWGMLRRFTYPLAFRVVLLSTEGLQWLETYIPRAKGVVIPNPVLFPLPSSAPVLPVEHFIMPERRLLLAVGRLDVQKGFADLLESFGALASRYLSWDLVILGEGPERFRLVQQVAALGLQQRVLLPGRAGNISDWYDRANLYVMSSRFEGFPNTLAEAMAYGCAAISYDCDTGPRDIIRHEQSGLLVTPVGDVPALTRAMEPLMGDDAARERMAARAIEVRERYSMSRILVLWDSLFDAEAVD